MIQKEISLYLDTLGRTEQVLVSQFDTMWQFVFKLYRNGQLWTIPSGATAVLNGLKPDGNVFAFSGTVSGNTVTVNCDIQMTACAGQVACELSLTSGGKIVSSRNFWLLVEEAPKSPDDVSSDTTLPAYEQMLAAFAALPVDIGESVEDWLDAHPEATTTVQDGSITEKKLNATLKSAVDVTPTFRAAYSTTESENVDINLNANLGASMFVSGEGYNPSTGAVTTGYNGARTELFPVKSGSTIHTLKNQGLVLFTNKKEFVQGYAVNVAIRDTVIPEGVYYAGIYSNTTAFKHDANSYFRALTNCYVKKLTFVSDDYYTEIANVNGLTAALRKPLNLNLRYFGTESESVNIQMVYGPSITDDDVFDNTDINSSGELVEATGKCVLKQLFYVKPSTSIYLPSKAPTVYFYDYYMNYLGAYGSNQTVTVPSTALYMRMKSSQAWGAYSREIFQNAKTNYLCSSYQLYYSDLAVDLNDENFEQISDFLSSGTSEIARVQKTQTIQRVNRMRHAWRIASFNTYLGNKNRWTELKNFLQNYGIDIIGFQEVNTPEQANSSGLTFAQALNSWHLSRFAVIETADVPSNCRPVAATSDFTVVSIEETKYATQSNYGHRHFTKTQLKLPRWKDKKSSENFMVSIYNTQLEVGTSTANNNTRLAQAAELLAAMQADTNPFVILVGDFNEMSTSWDTINAIRNAGYTPQLTDTSTPTAGRGFYDFIFVNNRITIVENDVIPYDLHNNISDHDLVFADVVFDYSNLIAVKTSLPNCSLSGGSYWLDRRQTEPVVYTVTPDEGYTVSSIATGQGDNDLAYTNGAVTKSGNTVTIIPNLVVGDVWINVTTAASS